MVFKDAYSKKNLDWRYIKTETIDLYKQGIGLLKMRGWIIKLSSVTAEEAYLRRLQKSLSKCVTSTNRLS